MKPAQKTLVLSLPLFAILFAVSCTHVRSMGQGQRVPSSSAPVADKQPVTFEKFGDVRIDNYAWMKERTSPKVLEHLTAENTYTAQQMSSTDELREQLFLEMKSRMKEADTSVPTQRRDYFYYSRTEEGRQYAIHARRKSSMTAAEEIILDENELAKGKGFMHCTGPMMSPNQNLMAYACDFKGDNLYELKIKDLQTGQMLPHTLKDIRGGITWANDNRHFFYVTPEPKTLRSRWVNRFDLQTGKTEVIHEEKDETWNAFVYAGKARNHLFVGSATRTATEIRTVPLDQPTQAPKMFLQREKDHKYSLEDAGDEVYILTNWKAPNNRIMKAKLSSPGKNSWKEVIPGRSDIYISDVEAFSKHLVYVEKEKGQDRIFVKDRNQKSPSRLIPLRDASAMIGLVGNVEFDAPHARYSYQSFRQPATVIDINLSDLSETVRKVAEVPGYDPSLYRTEKIWIPVRDGTLVPVDLVMQKNHKLDGSAPMLVYGYGAYGMSIDPYFSSGRMNMINRGWVFALAHIRGGRDLGEDWYVQGKLDKKMNSFTDFIDTTEALVQKGYADKKRVYARGESAGGLLMGAVINLRPDLYRGIIAGVPFVDVINTMLDPTLPLTTGEYNEWGNPNVEKDYKYIRQYSPYENVKAVSYPHIFATTGLNDSQVPYWEAAKWVAKIREVKTNDALILLKTDMGAGHGGASGRYDSLKDEAWNQAFLLMVDKF